MDVKNKVILKSFEDFEEANNILEEVQTSSKINQIEMRSGVMLLDISPIESANQSVDLPDEVREALATKLNSDPFGLGCGGKTLGWIWDNCKEFWEVATRKLKNVYIRERMQIIENFKEGIQSDIFE